eukprot:CAMPEP_0119511696 /NCGR_PEP_ID=MMETSP1344-20130328/30282_1 /TAXON_ID=236787 /ORGANISM="Florenciella parvula, Strain CCMP2471" /LENGTH=177 /DNA_ID=CAMNT_0007548733 /DNA_START=168 /DNA_END=697 /DNA_ORIENTATION=+
MPAQATAAPPANAPDMKATGAESPPPSLSSLLCATAAALLWSVFWRSSVLRAARDTVTSAPKTEMVASDKTSSVRQTIRVKRFAMSVRSIKSGRLGMLCSAMCSSTSALIISVSTSECAWMPTPEAAAGFLGQLLDAPVVPHFMRQLRQLFVAAELEDEGVAQKIDRYRSRERLQYL